jgi:hypothetical protein
MLAADLKHALGMELKTGGQVHLWRVVDRQWSGPPSIQKNGYDQNVFLIFLGATY